MKKMFLLIVSLLSVQIIYAQTDRNENWDLMAVIYYTGGVFIIADSVYTFHDDSMIDKVEYPKYQALMRKKSDSISIEWFKKYRENSRKQVVEKIQLEAIQYFVKPKRKILSKDTFIVTIRSMKSSHDLIYEKKISNVNESFRKDITFPDYIPLQRVKLQKPESIYFHCNSSDTSLSNIGHDFVVQNSSNRIKGIYPSTQKSELQQYFYRTTLNSLLFNQAKQSSIPESIWQKGFENVPHDTVCTNNSITIDTIEGIEKFTVIKKNLILPQKLILSTKVKSIVLLMDIILDGNFYQYKIVPWELYDDSHIPWTNCNPEEHIVEIPIKNAGEFVLYIKNSSEEDNETFSYRILVNLQWFQTLAFKITVASLIALGFLSVLFILYRRKQKQKIAFVEKQKAELDVNLNSMRSQLNPHFIFNALNSIQGLISSAKYDKAGEYLIHFSNLLRKPLNPEEIKHWTLNDEIELLNTYVKLEQLRSPFHFVMNVDKSLLVNQINFPALLLQPLVENAIKHGLARAGDPLLTIRFNKHHNDLNVIISDNGKGFDINEQKKGSGLKLSREYIELVNKQFPESNTSINFETNSEGTRVIISFQNWLDE